MQTALAERTQLPRMSADSGVGYYQKRYSGYIILWLRVYIRAAYDYVKYKKTRGIVKHRHFESARRWLFETNGGLDIVADVFNLPLEQLRERAKKMTKRDLKKLEHLERDGLAMHALEELTGASGGHGR